MDTTFARKDHAYEPANMWRWGMGLVPSCLLSLSLSLYMCMKVSGVQDLPDTQLRKL